MNSTVFSIRSVYDNLIWTTLGPYQNKSSLPLTSSSITPFPPRFCQRLFSIQQAKLDSVHTSTPISITSPAPHTNASTSTEDLHPSSDSIDMRRELDVTKTELAKSQVEVMKLEERCRMLEKTLRETKEILRARDYEIDKIKKERDNERASSIRRRSQEQSSTRPPLHIPNGSVHDKSSSHDRQTSQLNEAANQEKLKLRSTSAVGDQGEKLSITDEDRAHVQSLEVFLTKTDQWSGAQIIQAVQDLNSEILQFAATATELCAFDKPPRTAPPKAAQAISDTTSRLGVQLSRLLVTRDHAQDPILVQLALQGSISTCIARALSLFCAGLQSKSDAVFSQLYSLMYSSEPQPTSSRWRALTHKYIHHLHPNVADYASNDLVETILRWSSDIFIISNCVNRTGSFTALREGLRARFAPQILRIAKASCKLAKVTREEIMSTNFEVVAVEQGSAFETKGMVDVFGEYDHGTSSGTKGLVLCTTELGLRCTTRKVLNEPGRPDSETTFERRLLLRPKVVLDAVVDVLDPR